MHYKIFFIYCTIIKNENIMKQVNLTIEKRDISYLEKACNMLGIKLIEYADEIATINYYYETELFRLGSIYSLLRK